MRGDLQRIAWMRAGYLLLALAILAAAVGCRKSTPAQDLMEGVRAGTVEEKPMDEAFIGNSMRFALSLFQTTAKNGGGSVLLSPLSVQYALSMTANGAKGQTLEEMRSVLAGGMPMEELNAYLHTLRERLQREGEKEKVRLSNAIWYCDGTPIKPEFLQTNADYYGADAFQAPLDEQTLREINEWISAQTDGLIKEVLKDINPNALLYLVNTVLFDAEWLTPYAESDVSDGTFTSYGGRAQTVSFLHSEEETYLEYGKAKGFRKDYYGQRYSFVALLPDEGVDVFDYIADLTSDGLLATLKNGKQAHVNAAIPKFESGYDAELQDILPMMGMKTAFGTDADFSGMTEESDLYIGRVLHKTFISVGEKGTKAGAATVVEELTKGMSPEDTVTVTLDRPFVYLIVENGTNLPLFIGVQTEIGG